MSVQTYEFCLVFADLFDAERVATGEDDLLIVEAFKISGRWLKDWS